MTHAISFLSSVSNSSCSPAENGCKSTTFFNTDKIFFQKNHFPTLNYQAKQVLAYRKNFYIHRKTTRKTVFIVSKKQKKALFSAKTAKKRAISLQITLYLHFTNKKSSYNNLVGKEIARLTRGGMPRRERTGVGNDDAEVAHGEGTKENRRIV